MTKKQHEETVGAIIAEAVIRLNRVIDHNMGSTAFQEREKEFIEASMLGGKILAQKIDLTPERLLMFKVGALYITTFNEARNQRQLVQETDIHSIDIKESEE